MSLKMALERDMKMKKMCTLRLFIAKFFELRALLECSKSLLIDNQLA